MEDNDWDLSVVVRSCNINKPNDVTTPHSGLVTSENDDWNTFDKKFVVDMPNFNDLSEIFSIDFSVAHQKKSNDQVIITDQNSNQEIKNQSTRVFYEVLQEELTDDKWAWRKYGQKSIKGSPFPRSLALYNNSSKRKFPKGINIVPKVLNLNASLSSSKRAKHFKVDISSISPTAPTLEIERNNEMVDVVVENKDNIEEEENTHDNIFMDFEELQELLLPSYGDEMDKRN
ncbi:probable WRKY transcription factor 27 [Solanum tuberosum]|uniref:probable WRKY transcription factor 27 n=1 Tax=Solanum tuberosum TaxID=4113 RepID=UPI00073A414D|nr:PREDICTED: probable WRKY transcription factor 27 [Solanum tuberosum]